MSILCLRNKKGYILQMSYKFQTYKQLNLIGIIILTLFSLYLIIAIPSTLSGISYQKQKIIEAFGKTEVKEEAKEKFEQTFERIGRNEEEKVRLLFFSIIFNILMITLLLANFFIFRRLKKHSNSLDKKEVTEKSN